ncbi:ankyrin repeat protein [Bacteriovorax sp. BSW11_IV]|uniref:ankyrin repeat domain-containing protein n=1 Tax=Bacteriovorax sp. BSW11_IV TaxID=1353529 RepID=UPI00038A1B42|nr:ankyrin repeat domain-containing protein [Bacteriovorax sp. BSW11_IV]EQC45060.1 ankyrin repeat protein [Bacteriovorax sp. BSW11_IV]
MISKLIILVMTLLSFRAHSLSLDTKKLIDAGNLSSIEKLDTKELDGASLDEAGRSALMYAIQKKEYGIAKYLITRNLGVNARDYLGRSPLLFAAMNVEQSTFMSFLLESGIDFFAKDRRGRGLDYYMAKNKSQSIQKLIKNKALSQKGPSKEQNLALQKALDSGEVSEIEKYLGLYKTLHFSIDGKGVVEYLIVSGAIKKWSLKVLAKYGVDVLADGVAQELIKSELFEHFREISKYKFNLQDENKRDIIQLALVHKAPSDITVDLINRQRDLAISDINNNNYLHLALTHDSDKRVLDILKQKGVSTIQYNTEGKSPAMIEVDQSSPEEILTILKANSNNLNVKNQKGDDLVMYIAKVSPTVIKNNIQLIQSLKYDFNSRNDLGQNALSIVGVKLDSSRIDSKDLNKIPEAKKDLNQLNEYKVDGAFSHKEILEDSYLGDRVFDDLVNSLVSEHLKDLENQYIQKYLSHDDSNSDSLKLDIKSRKNAIKQLENNSHNLASRERELLALLESGRLSTRDGDFRRSHEQYSQLTNELIQKVNELKNYVNYINEDFTELSSKKSELESIINLFKGGKDKFSMEIKDKRDFLTNFKEEITITIKSYEAQRRKSLDFIRYEYDDAVSRLNDAKNNLNEVGHKRNRAENAYNDLYNKRKQYEANENHPGHNPNDCQWTGLKISADKRLPGLESNMKASVKEYERYERYYQEAKSYENRVSNKYTKEKSVVEKEILEFQKDQQNRFKTIERNTINEISSLEGQRELDYNEVSAEVTALIQNVELKYGPIDSVTSSWKIIYDYASQLSSVDSLKSKVACFFGSSCSPLIDTKALEGTKIGDQFIALSSQIAATYEQYMHKELQFNSVTHLQRSFDQTVSELNSVRQNKDSNALKIRDYRAELGRLEEELSSLQLGENKDFSDLLELEKRLYQGLDVSLDSLKLKRADHGIRSTRGLNEFTKKTEILEYSLHLSDISDEEIISKTQLSSEKTVSYLNRWFTILSEKAQSQSNTAISFYNEINRMIFIRALMSSTSFQLVKSEHSETLVVTISGQEFLLGEDGYPVSLESDNPLDFELITTGSARASAIAFIEKLKEKFPDLTKEDLERNHDLAIVISLLKEVDQFNDSQKMLQYLEIAEVMIAPIALVTPAGVGLKVIPAIFGLSKCAAEAIIYFRTGMYRTDSSKFLWSLTCFVNALLSTSLKADKIYHVFDEFVANIIPSKLFIKLLKIFIKDDISNLKNTKSLFLFIETLFNAKITEFDNYIFRDNRNKIEAKISSFIISVNNLVSSEETTVKLYNTDIVARGFKVVKPFSFNSFKYRDTIFMNVCDLSKDELQNLLAVKFGFEESIIDINSFNYDMGDSLYKVNGEKCLILKE